MNDQNDLNPDLNTMGATSFTSVKWTSENVRALRLRLGFSAADLARRLGCGCEKVRSWEMDMAYPLESEVDGLELLSHQAEANSAELAQLPILDQLFDRSSIAQIDLLDLKR